MASSLININEATARELQELEGIGPRRSTYIVDFRDQVALIRNTFDLATATGLSIKAAERLSPRIDWKALPAQPFGLWPAGFVTLASLWLIVSGFNQLAREPFVAPEGYYNLCLALILLGGLSATSDIGIAMLKRRQRGSVWGSMIATGLFASGFSLLMLLAATSTFLTYSPEFQQTLERTVLFIAYCALMFWLIYGPAFCLRQFIEDRQLDKLDTSKFLYDLSLALAPMLPLYQHLVTDDPTRTTEIFTLWCGVLITLGALELIRGRSAFISILSEIDQSRFRFAYYARGRKEEKNTTASILGWICLAEAVILFGVLAAGVRLP